MSLHQCLVIRSKFRQLWKHHGITSKIRESHTHTLFLSSCSVVGPFLDRSYSSLVVFLSTTTRLGGKPLAFLTSLPLLTSAEPQRGHWTNCRRRPAMTVGYAHFYLSCTSRGRLEFLVLTTIHLSSTRNDFQQQISHRLPATARPGRLSGSQLHACRSQTFSQTESADF